MFNIVPFIVIVVSLLVIIIVITRRYTDILVIDPNTIPEERDRKKKNEILTNRIDRRAKIFWQKTQKILQPLGKKMVQIFEKYYRKIIEYERKNRLQKKSLGIQAFSEEKVDEVIFSQQEVEEEHTSTEEEYINMLEKNPRDTAAYFGLAELYRERGDTNLARETIQHILKLEPNNPRFLDAMIGLSIIEGDQKGAQKALLRLTEVNPENAKIKELEERVGRM